MTTKKKTIKKEYTVRIEWPVTYYCDTTVEASSPEEAARIAMEDPDYDNQRAYDDDGGNTVEGVCEGGGGVWVQSGRVQGGEAVQLLEGIDQRRRPPLRLAPHRRRDDDRLIGGAFARHVALFPQAWENLPLPHGQQAPSI